MKHRLTHASPEMLERWVDVFTVKDYVGVTQVNIPDGNDKNWY
jgi:hypothetical protein